MWTYERKDSQFVWAKWTDPVSGKARFRSTRVRKDDPQREQRLARALNNLQREVLDQAERTPDGIAATDPSHWAAWVPNYFASHYGSEESAGTLAQYRMRWKPIAQFLAEHRLMRPRDVTREHADRYLLWRAGQRRGKFGKTIGRNTAIAELKLLTHLLKVAAERHYIPANPLAALGLKRDPVRVKPELLDDEIQLIREGLAELGLEWMRVAFEVALYTALRRAETRLALDRVDFVSGTIHIPSPKGGASRAFTVPLDPELAPVLLARRRGGHTHAWDRPREKGQLPLGIAFRRFFDAIGLRHVCLHCTRVTFISRGCRAGIPRDVMMRMVNHGSAEVHAIYQRIQVADLQRWRPMLTLPAPLPHQTDGRRATS